MANRTAQPGLPWRSVIGALVLGSILALILLREVASPVRIEGSSMRPTLEDGSVCLVMWTARARREARVGSIVLASLPAAAGGARVVKRIEDASGDAPQRRFTLAGDNGGLSRDSRAFGDVIEERVQGVLVARLFPRPRYWGVEGPPAPALGSREALSPAGR